MNLDLDPPDPDPLDFGVPDIHSISGQTAAFAAAASVSS